MSSVPSIRAVRTSRRSRLQPIALSEEERRELQRWSRQRNPRALRARIVLRCLPGRSNREVARALVAAVVAKTLHEPPPGTGRWSSRRLANELGISQRAVLRIWHTFEL